MYFVWVCLYFCKEEGGGEHVINNEFCLGLTTFAEADFFLGGGEGGQVVMHKATLWYGINLTCLTQNIALFGSPSPFFKILDPQMYISLFWFYKLSFSSHICNRLQIFKKMSVSMSLQRELPDKCPSRNIKII